MSALCVSAGVEMATASAPAAASASSESKVATRVFRSTRARRSGDRVTTPRKAHSAAGGEQRGMEPAPAEAVADQPEPHGIAHAPR